MIFFNFPTRNLFDLVFSWLIEGLGCFGGFRLDPLYEILCYLVVPDSNLKTTGAPNHQLTHCPLPPITPWFGEKMGAISNRIVTFQITAILPSLWEKSVVDQTTNKPLVFQLANIQNHQTQNHQLTGWWHHPWGRIFTHFDSAYMFQMGWLVVFHHKVTISLSRRLCVSKDPNCNQGSGLLDLRLGLCQFGVLVLTTWFFTSSILTFHF